MEKLYSKARETAESVFGKKIYIRGLIEFSNHCKNDCRYCGIRRSNRNIKRYRLTPEEILSCCDEGYELGYRTFVLQGGEDPGFSDQEIEELVIKIKASHPDCAVTLSVGERERDVYKRWFDAGADRYLLRHETADEEHYSSLHPKEMSFRHRIECLYNLKSIGYQVGCGFMVGSPGQNAYTLYKDLKLIDDLEPHMVGIGPFLPHSDTPYAGEPPGSLRITRIMLALLRISHPKLLLPATTALGTLQYDGREKGILSGANVIMPNLSPVRVRKLYSLYDNKICTGEESAQCVGCIDKRITAIGYEVVSDRGDHPDMKQ